MERIITIIIHGTFAADENWWKLGTDGEVTFANRLERTLSKRGSAKTVWQPALDNDLTYESFSWSGENRHHSRMIGAKKIASSLRILANKIGATSSSPLMVNFIAHSHGGNVVLEVLKQLDKNIHPRKVILLGTPLIAFKPALRIFRIISAYAIFTILVLIGLFLMLQILSFVMNTKILDLQNIDGWYLIMILLMSVILYGWILSFVAKIGDLIWGLIFSPIKFITGRIMRQAYGPSTMNLKKIMREKPISLFTSYGDEADLILHLTSAPRHLYIEHIEQKWKLVARILERIFLRPMVVGLFLRVLEIIFERCALGFSWLRVLFFDYDMADLKNGKEYPDSIFKRVDVTNEVDTTELDSAAQSIHKSMILKRKTQNVTGVKRRTESLRQTITEVGENIMHQIKLRHSLYYQNDGVLKKIVEALME